MTRRTEPEARRSVALIGMRGSGKSTVGRIVASRLGVPFVDTDEEIARSCACSIADVFRERGEPAFRELEREAIARISASEAGVVAVGGGAVLWPQNVAALQGMARVIWLVASPSVLAERVAKDSATVSTRPRFTSLPLEEELATILRQREGLYREAADWLVETDRRSAADVATEIVDALARRTR
jgi:shikimate kinase